MEGKDAMKQLRKSISFKQSTAVAKVKAPRRVVSPFMFTVLQ